MPLTPAPLAPAIVLVDDEPDVRFVLTRLLAHIVDGYPLVALDNGAAALAEVLARPVPLLLTDYSMPGMTGLELAQKVKAASPTTMVVLISANVTPVLKQRAQAAGVDHFLPKPFPFDQVEAIVRAALAAHGQ